MGRMAQQPLLLLEHGKALDSKPVKAPKVVQRAFTGKRRQCYKKRRKKKCPRLLDSLASCKLIDSEQLQIYNYAGVKLCKTQIQLKNCLYEERCFS